VPKKSSLKSFILLLCLSALMAAIFLHMFSNHFLQKQQYNLLQLREKVEQSKVKMNSQDISFMIKNLSLKQILLQKILMQVINDFSSGIFWQRISMKEGKIFLEGEVPTISALTYFLLQSKKCQLNFELQYIKKSAEIFEFELHVKS